MAVRLIQKQLVVHNDLAIGAGTIQQQRGPLISDEQQIELTFIFRSIAEIRSLDICRYTRVQLHQQGCNLEYWYNEDSTEDDDGLNILKPNTVPAEDNGRWQRAICGGDGGDGGGGDGMPQPHALYGPFHTDVCSDGPGTETFIGGEILAWDPVAEKWCPTLLDCYCIKVNGRNVIDEESEEEEIVLQDCESLGKFFDIYGGNFLFLTRNFLEDAEFTSPVSGDIVPAVPDLPYGQMYDAGGTSTSVLGELDFCDGSGVEVISWQGGSPPNTAYKIKQGGVGNPNSITLTAIVRPGNTSGGVLFTVEGLGPAYVIKWDPVTGRITYAQGDLFDGDDACELILNGPIGYDGPTPIWRRISVTIGRSFGVLSMISRWDDRDNEGPQIHTNSTSLTQSGNFNLSDRPFWTSVLDPDNYEIIFGHGTSGSGRAGITADILWTGVFDGAPTAEFELIFDYAFKQNKTTFDVDVDGLPPSDTDSVLKYDPETDSWKVVPAHPSGAVGQYLRKSGTGNDDVEWADLPVELPAGGDTNSILAKASSDDYDVEWRTRDSKTFFGSSDPAAEALAGDFWYGDI